MNNEKINKIYKKIFPDSEVYYDEGLEIYINARESVTVKTITEEEGYQFASDLLDKWDFSYFLEFENKEDAYNWIK